MKTQSLQTTIELSSWVTLPRSLYKNFLRKKITGTSYLIYILLRNSSDMYGTSVTSTGDLVNLLKRLTGRKLKDDTVTKALNSLRDQNLIYYPRRTGESGPFEVQLGEFLLPKDKIKLIDTNDPKGYYIVSADTVGFISSDVGHEAAPSNQTLSQDNNPVVTNDSIDFTLAEIGGINKDTEKDKEKETKQNRCVISRKSLPIKFYLTDNDKDRTRIKEIANLIEERDMNYLDATLRNHGIAVIEEAYRKFEKADSSPHKDLIGKKGGYFRRILENLIENGDVDNSPS